MTRAQRLAKAAAWEKLAQRLWRDCLPYYKAAALGLTEDVQLVAEERRKSKPVGWSLPCFDWLDPNLMSLHCLSEAARLRSGVPV